MHFFLSACSSSLIRYFHFVLVLEILNCQLHAVLTPVAALGNFSKKKTLFTESITVARGEHLRSVSNNREFNTQWRS